MGFRSDIVQTEYKQEYAIFVNGTAPSRFNSPIQLTTNSYLTDAANNSSKLYTAGGYWNVSQASTGGGGGVGFCFRFNDDRQTPNSWLKWSGKDAEGNTQNGWFGYEQDTKRYRFLNDTGTYSMYEIQVDSSNASFNVANGDLNMLRVARANNTQTIERSWTQIAAGSMPADYEPNQDQALATKKYCDDEISQAIAGNQSDTTVVAGTPTGNQEPDAAPGSMMFDENFMYIRTNSRWKKIPLYTLSDASAVGRVTVQMTQAQYQALGTKDQNTLYVIVG
jgi:hypothetical protein